VAQSLATKVASAEKLDVVNLIKGEDVGLEAFDNRANLA
jgi:hypothetical protein